MHQYLDAIGFKNTFSRESEIDLMLDNLFHSHDSRKAAREETPGCAFLESSKGYGPGIGIRLCGQMDPGGFHRTHYFPYMEKRQVSLTDYVSIEKRANGNGYTGMVDNSGLPMSILFFLQNAAFIKKRDMRSKLSHTKVSIILTGLSNSGKILLGHSQTGTSDATQRKKDEDERQKLIEAARKGNQNAIESLTMDDMDIFAMLSRRLPKEDLYTIVESSFMPCGMECDLYRILGTILFYAKVRNSLTRQYLYQLTVDCNGIPIDVCINEQDLLGEPQVGRRFKGTIWLQGKLELHEGETVESESEKAVAEDTL